MPETESSKTPAPIEPQPPKGADAAQVEEARGKALAIVQQITADPGDLETRRKVTMFGAEAEERASQTIELLDTKLGTLMKGIEGGNDPIGKGLLDLRRITDELNPHPRLKEREEILSRKGLAGFVTRTLRKVPTVGDILADIAAKQQSLQTQVDAIIDGLRGGCDMLLHDNIELEQLYDRVREQHAVVRLVAYQAEVIWAELERAKAESTDPAEQRRLDAMVSKIATRVQDLRMMEQVFEQFYASITLTTDNNLELIDSAKRTMTVTKNLLTVGLAIQAGLQRQKQVATAVQATRETASDLLAANAAALREQSAQINEMANSPVLAMDKLRSAHEDLIAAMDEADAARKMAAEKARRNLGEIAGMRRQLEERTAAFVAAKGVEGQLEIEGEA
ncbi:MAG TPA: toxic anion resistance protein [Longimicrobiales bacterium]